MPGSENTTDRDVEAPRLVERTPSTIRVVSLNIWGFGPNRTERLSAIGNGLVALQPDVVCLQESWAGAPEVLADVLKFGSVSQPDARGQTGNAVISRLDCDSASSWELPGSDEIDAKRHVTIMDLVSETGRKWSIASTHLAWGSSCEGIRFDQARDIERRFAERSKGVAVLCADANALPESETIRYLTGLGVHPDGSSTQWLDSFAVAGFGPSSTSEASNEHVRSGATSWDIARPDLLPSRRIDFILVRGYRYGKPGCPLRAERVLDREVSTEFGSFLPSDHFGVLADLWDPTL